MRKPGFAIVDEADSLLLDQARTPLILSETAEISKEEEVLYKRAAEFAKILSPEDVDIDNENYHYGNIRGLAIANDKKVEYITTDFISFDFDLIDYLADNNIVKNVFDSKQAYLSLRKIGITLHSI